MAMGERDRNSNQIAEYEVVSVLSSKYDDRVRVVEAKKSIVRSEDV